MNRIEAKNPEDQDKLDGLVKCYNDLRDWREESETRDYQMAELNNEIGHLVHPRHITPRRPSGRRQASSRAEALDMMAQAFGRKQ